ncbi:fluoride efflux transporter FluC [Streptomyces tendae]|uniref:fluoride efflux transporter FluC n=1 Tax=Streptomyces tendae TaxID=1932 RepID=UPI003819C69A
MMEWLLVLAGGALGAPARYLIGAAAKEHLRSSFHWGTFLANMAAALLLGFLVQAGTEGALGQTGQALLSTGFCGALSTWSTFSNEVHAMASAARVAGAAVYVLVTVALGLGLSFTGMAVAQALW